ncbi:MAG TPA: hypothetical protein VFL30_03335 [Rhodanobacteraceae bacterium]|nr:hypothetical protein [Rhodanobacteraceae bacterium]
MLKRLRIAFLLYVLLFVVAAQYVGGRSATDWDAPLWVDIYAVAGDERPVTRRFIEDLNATEFAAAEEFFAREGQRYGVALEQPFELRFLGEYGGELPQLDAGAGPFGVLLWSLRMRWLATRLRWQAERSGDIIVFAVFHEPTQGVALDRSTALNKGLIAVANLFADRKARATNEIVLAHELLHTLRATDKYSLTTNAPSFPDGYAAPDARPLLPQTKAELMAGRIALDERHAEMPSDLDEVVIGAATAREIGWQSRR